MGLFLPRLQRTVIADSISFSRAIIGSSSLFSALVVTSVQNDAKADLESLFLDDDFEMIKSKVENNDHEDIDLIKRRRSLI